MTYKKKRQTLITAQEIMRMYEEDEFVPFIIYGGLGYGKSSYAIRVLSEVYGDSSGPNFEAVKERIVFLPEQFLSACQKVEDAERDKALIWDDAGFWLYSLDYYKPLVKAVTKYLSVARTHWASILFTTPVSDWIVKKAVNMPDERLVRISKQTSVVHTDKEGEKRLYKYRNAFVYRSWRSPDGKKSGVKTIYIDKYNAMLPDDFYSWYKKKRDSYAQQGMNMIKNEIEKEKHKKEINKQLGIDEEEEVKNVR